METKAETRRLNKLEKIEDEQFSKDNPRALKPIKRQRQYRNPVTLKSILGDLGRNLDL